MPTTGHVEDYIDGLTEETTPDIDNDMLLIRDDTDGSMKKIAPANLGSGRVLLSKTIADGSSGTVTLNPVPSIFDKIVIEIFARSTRSATSDNILCYLNNDTTATNYRYVTGNHYGSTASSGAGDLALLGSIAAANSPSNSVGSVLSTLLEYTNTTFKKQIVSDWSYRADDSSLHEVRQVGGTEWENTAAVTRIDLVLQYGNFVSGSIIRIYGEY